MINALAVVGVTASITTPVNWIVRLLLARVGAVGTGGAVGAGRWIGILERMIIYLLVVVDEAGAAALVVAAKAILRFPEITGDEEHLSAEYVLVGSLASWLLAIAAGVGTRLIVGA